MALIFAEGFDLFDSSAELQMGGFPQADSAVVGFNATGGRWGGGCLEISGSTGGGVPISVISAAGTTVFIGFHFFMAAETFTATTLMALRVSSAAILNMAVNPTGAVRFTDGSSLQVHPTDGQGLATNCWHWVELQVVLGTNDTNGSFELRIDGVTYCSGATLDTYGGTNTQLTELRFSGNSVYKIDDLMAWSSTGAAPNTWLGGARITTLRPTADGAVVNWTANTGTDVGAVDDANGSSNGDTDYIASSTATQRSRFVMGDLANAGDTIAGVQVRLRAKKSDTQPRVVQAYVRSGSSETDSSDIYLTSEYLVHRASNVAVDPNGGGAWTKTAIDAIEVGVELVS